MGMRATEGRAMPLEHEGSAAARKESSLSQGAPRIQFDSGSHGWRQHRQARHALVTIHVGCTSHAASCSAVLGHSSTQRAPRDKRGLVPGGFSPSGHERNSAGLDSVEGHPRVAQFIQTVAVCDVGRTFGTSSFRPWPGQ